MVSKLQKQKLINSALVERMKSGHAPSIESVVSSIVKFLNGRRFGMPLALLRPARSGDIIGGPKGTDISDIFFELREDLDLLYTALIASSSSTIDTYDIFSNRYDRLVLKASKLRQQVLTLLAQQGAATQNSIADNFKTLDLVNLSLTTAQIDLQEGSVSLPISNSTSIRYDGARLKLVSTSAPAGTTLAGASFDSVFSPYRTDAWVASIPVGQEYIAVVNVTGADFEKGDTEEVSINAIKISPAGPIHVFIEWSPDGFNWHNLSPIPNATIREPFTFHFTTVSVGFFRFHIKHSEEITAANTGQTRPVAIKSVELYHRGFSSSASFYSSALQVKDVVHSVVATIDSQIPLGTTISPFISQNIDGPWLPITKDPVTFDTIKWLELPAPSVISEEIPGLPSTMWEFPIDSSSPPIPELGQLISGTDQVELSAFMFDWSKVGDVNHIPTVADWTTPYGMVRQGTFGHLNDLSILGSTDFSDNKNPISIDTIGGHNYLILAIIQQDGSFILQPGYTYRMRAFVFCSFPTTLGNQQIGVVNTGGLAGISIAPLSLYVNGTKLYQKDTCVSSIPDLSGMSFTTTIPFFQGWNTIELYLQIPAGITPGSGGVAANNVYVYLQPNLFASNREIDFGLQYVQAYKDPWKQVSEFDLRYNTPIGVRQVWAWKYEYITSGATDRHIADVLLNHDPTNSQMRGLTSGDIHASQYTIDGVNLSNATALLLRYPVEKSVDAEAGGRHLYFRADLSMSSTATIPPSIHSYRFLIN